MKHNLEHFSEIMEKWQSQITEEMRTEDKFLKLASHNVADFLSCHQLAIFRWHWAATNPVTAAFS